MSTSASPAPRTPASTSSTGSEQAPSSSRNRLAAFLAGAAVIAAGTAGVATAAGAADTRPTMHVVRHDGSGYQVIPAHWSRNIADNLDRKVANGFGTADLGGAWTTSSPSSFAVGSTGGRIGPLAAGDAVRATVSGVKDDDEYLDADFVIPSVPRGADTSFVALELRRQANGDSYRVRVRMDSKGALTLAISRLQGGREYRLGDVAPVAGVAGGGRVLSLAARITGSAPVHIAATAKPAGAAATTITRDDTSAGRVDNAGNFGVLAGNARQAGAMTATLRTITGFKFVPATRIKTDPSPTTSPTSSPAPTGSSSSPAPSDPSSSSAPSDPSSTSPAPSSPSSSSPAPSDPSSSTPAPGDPTPTPTNNRGAAPLGTANYPVPAGAIFVSPTGSDTAAGTQAAPLRTIARAVAVAPSGATIVLRAGSYHESVTVVAKKRVTLQNYPGEVVWFDGSVPVTTWSQQGSTWVHDGWTAKFDSTPGYTAAQAKQYDWLRPGYPMAAHPDQVFVDGTQLKQVGSAAAVVPGTFYSDYADNRIVLGTNPNGHAVRATDLQTALTVWSPGSIVRGIGFHRYATSVTQVGAVSLRAADQVMQNVVVTDIATMGIHANSTNQVLDHDTVTNNGLQGIHGIADHLHISNSIVTGNNSEMFNVAPVSAGIKLSWSDYDVVVNNLIADNNGNGLWFDMSSYGMTVAGNDILNNEHIGLSVEISKGGLLVGNTVSNNGWDGIRICDSSDVRIWNNVLVNNVSRNIDIAQDYRTTDNSNRPFPTSTVDWKVRNVEVRNNVMIGSDTHVNYGDPAVKLSPMARQIVVDNNLFSNIDGRTSGTFALNNGRFARYTLAAWIAYTNSGSHNVQSSGRTAGTMSSDMSNDALAAALPADVAGLLGQPAGSKVWGRD